MSDEQQPNPVESASSASRKTRLRFPIAVIALALIVQIAIWIFTDDDYSMFVGFTGVTWFIATVHLLVWWLFFSRLPMKTRLLGVGGLGLAGVAFVGLFRMDGQGGDFIPKFSFRFSPSAEDRAVEYFESNQASTALPAGEAADGELGPAEALPGDEQTALGRLEVTQYDWPRFGGPRGDHIVRETIRRDWDTNPPQALWRHPIGPGWSSFAVVGSLAFTQEQRGEEEAVVCYEAETGKQVWAHTDQTRFTERASGAGPRATPTIHDSKLYSLGATGILNCLDPLTGELFWTTDIVEDAQTELVEWGMCGSPLIHNDLVIVTPGGDTGAVAAYDRLTGEKRWAGGGHQAGYSSPQIATLDGVPQVLVFCAEGLCGHDLNSGQHLWSFEWTNVTQINVAQPIVLPDTSVFISTGYGTGSALLDVSQKDGDWSAEPRWTRANKFKLKFNGGIYRDGHVYGLDEGILSCFDLDQGERTWKRGRYKYGQILMVGDDLLVAAESGEVVLVEANPTSAKEIAKFQAIEGKTWNHPVVSQGLLFVRNAQEAACYDLRPETKVAVLQSSNAR